MPTRASPRLIVVSGLPGTGKSALAEGLGRALDIPVFAKDRLEAALLRSGIGRDQNSGWAGYELLTALAESQLRLGQSAILDSVATKERIRQRWRELAQAHGAVFRAVECVCADETLHQARLVGRQRGIPGWPELEWADVERVRATYDPWQGERLVLDMARCAEENLAAALDYVRPAPHTAAVNL